MDVCELFRGLSGRLFAAKHPAEPEDRRRSTNSATSSAWASTRGSKRRRTGTKTKACC